MDRFVSLISGLFWLLLGLTTSSLGWLAGLMFYTSRGDFYTQTVDWLTMQAFLGHINRNFVDALLTLTPMVMIVLGFMMLWTAVQAVRYALLKQPLRSLSQTFMFSGAMMLLVFLLLIHINNALPNWIDYARAQLPQPITEPVSTSSEAEVPLTSPAPQFLNIELPEPHTLLKFYEQQVLPMVLSIGVVLLVILAGITILTYTKAPTPQTKDVP